MWDKQGINVLYFNLLTLFIARITELDEAIITIKLFKNGCGALCVQGKCISDDDSQFYTSSILSFQVKV